MELIDKINQVLEQYFTENTEVNCIALKNIMPSMVKAGVFNKDVRKGLPLRKVLRTLDKDNSLEKIPLLYAHRMEQDVYWYFRRPDTDCDLIQLNEGPTKKEIALKKHEASDEFYVLGLCDEILEQNSKRQHRFKFLVGDLHKDGQARTMLPLDAFYENSSLVIEYDPKFKEEESNDESTVRKTNSGISRSEQRERYDNRKNEVLTDRGIKLLRVSHSDFTNNDEGIIVRNEEEDMKILIELINSTKLKA